MRLPIVTEDKLDQVPIPVYSEGNYTVVRHTKALSIVRSCLEKQNMSIEAERLYLSSNGQLAYGEIQLKQNADEENSCIVMFLNSYDKSRAFRINAALRMKDSGNIISLGTSEYGNYKRVHKGAANEAIEEALCNTVQNLTSDFLKLVEQKKTMRNLMVDRIDIMSMLGEIFFDEQLVTSEQVNHIRLSLNDPKYTYNYLGSSLFFVYMICASALENRGNTIGTYYDSHKGLNEYFAKKVEELNIQEDIQRVETTYYALWDLQTGRRMATGLNVNTIKELGEAFFEYKEIDAEMEDEETLNALLGDDEGRIVDIINACDFTVEIQKEPFVDHKYDDDEPEEEGIQGYDSFESMAYTR